MRKLIAVVFTATLALSVAYAVEQPAAAKKDHIMVMAKDVQWKDGPPSLPPGAKVSVIEGDPAKEGPFTMRLKFPANYKIPAHFHPGVEHITVIEGSFQMGL